jgi:hypothetical protein
VKPFIRPIVLILLAPLLWVVADRIEFRTEFTLAVEPDRVIFKSAATEVVVPMHSGPVDRVSVRVHDSVYPTGSHYFRVVKDDQVVLSLDLPRTFEFPGKKFQPLGDWTVDTPSASRMVADRVPLAVEPPFRLEASFRGRSNKAASVQFRGKPGVGVRFRHGLMNNGLTVTTGNGAPVKSSPIRISAVTTILSIGEMILRSLAYACLLLGGFSLILRAAHQWRRRPVSRPAKGPQFVELGSAALAILLVVASFALNYWVATDILHKLPHAQDDVAYLLHARWLADGQLYGAEPPLAKYLKVPFTYFRDGKWFTHYPVLWPLLLSPGVAVGMHWLMPPLFGALFMVALYGLGRELYGPLVGLAALLIAAVSPMRLLMHGSLLSHGAAAACTVLFVWALAAGRRRQSPKILLASGVMLGFVFGIRPLTALALGLPAGVWLLRGYTLTSKATALRELKSFAIGGLLGVLPTLVYNHLLMGSPLTSSYSVYPGFTAFAVNQLSHGLRNLDVRLAYTLPAVLGWGWPTWSGWLVLAAPLGLPLVTFVSKHRDVRDWFVLSFFVAVTLAHVLSGYEGFHGFGPRYYFEVFFVLYLLAARSLQVLARESLEPFWGGAICASVLLVLTVHTGSTLPERLNHYQGYNYVDQRLTRAVEKQNVHNAVVLLPGRFWARWGQAANITSVDPHAEIVVANETNDMARLVASYPGRRFYRWGNGRLVEVRPKTLAAWAAAAPDGTSALPGRTAEAPPSVRYFGLIILTYAAGILAADRLASSVLARARG